MRLVTDSPVSVAWVAGKHEYPKDSLTLIVKATFQIQANDLAQVLEESRHVMGDEFQDGNMRLMQTYESDFAIFKPKADVFLMGSCHTPEQQSMTSCQVEFSLGGVNKSAKVSGPRFQIPGVFGGTSASEAMPFTVSRITTPGGAPHHLAEFETPASEGSQTPLPSISTAEEGFGPIHRTSDSRKQYLGTYDEKWKKERWPWFPDDFDYQHFNAAPEDMQSDYLTGDETFTAVHLHPEHAQFNGQLPGKVARIFLNRSTSADDPAEAALEEVPLNLDTCWIDMDSGTMQLVWRGVAEAESQKYTEFAHVYAGLDELSEPLGEEEHTERFMALAFPVEVVETDEQDESEEVEEETEEAKPMAAGEEDPLDKAIEEAMAKTREELTKAGHDPALADQLALSEDPLAGLQQMYADMGVSPADMEAAITATNEKAKQQLLESGLSEEDVKLLLGDAV